MTIRRFVIPSLFAAGFGAHDPAQASFTHATTTGANDPNNATLLRLFQQDHYVTLAQHRSHSSHASHSSGGSSGGSGHYSHSSHTSHRSSTGGYDPYYPTPAPAPVYYPPPPPPAPAPAPASSRPRAAPPSGPSSPGYRLVAPNSSTRAAAPPGDELPALSGRSNRFIAIVRRVQIALMGQGVFDGPINGAVGPATRGAIRRFQGSRGLTQTGTITPELLDALMISSE